MSLAIPRNNWRRGWDRLPASRLAGLAGRGPARLEPELLMNRGFESGLLQRQCVFEDVRDEPDWRRGWDRLPASRLAGLAGRGPARLEPELLMNRGFESGLLQRQCVFEDVRDEPDWRRGWDSNPRYGETVHLISSQARSTTPAPLRLTSKLSLAPSGARTPDWTRIAFGRFSPLRGACGVQNALAFCRVRPVRPLRHLSDSLANCHWRLPAPAHLIGLESPLGDSRPFGAPAASKTLSRFVESGPFDPIRLEC